MTEKISINLLHESIWEIEDKVKVLIESVSKLETEIIKLKNQHEQTTRIVHKYKKQNGKRK